MAGSLIRKYSAFAGPAVKDKFGRGFRSRVGDQMDRYYRLKSGEDEEGGNAGPSSQRASKGADEISRKLKSADLQQSMMMWPSESYALFFLLTPHFMR